MGNKTASSNAASVLVERNYQARVEHLGIKCLQKVAREEKLGGRPKGTEKKELAKQKAASDGL